MQAAGSSENVGNKLQINTVSYLRRLNFINSAVEKSLSPSLNAFVFVSSLAVHYPQRNSYRREKRRTGRFGRKQIERGLHVTLIGHSERTDGFIAFKFRS